MREIKFRGIRVDNGEWVCGFLMSLNRIMVWDEDCDMRSESYEVIPETVGQSTGLKDKNGKEIYEGDIIKADNPPRGNGFYDVAWSEMFHGWIGNSQDEMLQLKPCMFDETEIIGDIHTNPLEKE